MDNFFTPSCRLAKAHAGIYTVTKYLSAKHGPKGKVIKTLKKKKKKKLLSDFPNNKFIYLFLLEEKKKKLIFLIYLAVSMGIIEAIIGKN